MSIRQRLATRTGKIVAIALAVVVVSSGLAYAAVRVNRRPAVIVSYSPTTSTPPTEPATIPQPETTLPPPAPPINGGAAVGLKVADGQPYPPAIEFTSTIPIPTDLVFVLVLGSDARPNEDLLKTRSDSIHLVALNPRSGQGTIVGFPRDSYVDYPNGGRGKINDALARGGPTYVAETVRRLTGLPVQYYVLTGFVGLAKMVDELGWVDIRVEKRMNDPLSGARFEAGWHHFSGAQTLAFSRNRHDVPDGDFTRSLHQGAVLLAALGKLRSEVGDDPGLFRWLGVMTKYTKLDVPADHLPKLAALARRMEPERITNVVLPGRIATTKGGASVVYLTEDAPRLFVDLRDDAVIGSAEAAVTTTTVAPAPTTTTQPTAPSQPPPATTSTTSLLGI